MNSLFFSDNTSFHVKFFSIIFSLLPFFLITGPALPDIAISVLGVYFLIIIVVEKKFRYFQNFFLIVFLIFCLYGLIRSFFSQMPMESLTNEGSLFYFRYVFFVFATVYLLTKNPKICFLFILTSITCIIVVSLDGIYQFFNGTNILGYEKFGRGDRLTGLFRDEPIIGRYLSQITPLTISLIYFFYGTSKKIVTSTVILLIIVEIVVFISGERAPFFFIVFYNLLLLIFIPEIKIARIIGIFISALIILLITQKSEIVNKRMVNETLTQISDTKFKFLPYSEHHEQHYISSIKMMNDNILFGQGTNLYRYLCSDEKFIYKDRSCSNHPHNYYIQILAEQGLFGFVFLLLFYIWLSYLLLKNFLLLIFKNKKNENYLIFLIILIVFWWPIIPHQSFYNNWNNVLIFLPLGFFIKNYFFNTVKNDI